MAFPLNHLPSPSQSPATIRQPLTTRTATDQIKCRQLWDVLTPTQQQSFFSTIIHVCRQLATSELQCDSAAGEVRDEQS